MQVDHARPKPDQHLRRGLTTDSPICQVIVFKKLRRARNPEIRDGITHEYDPVAVIFLCFKYFIGIAVPAKVGPVLRTAKRTKGYQNANR
jgi:hypothetical protein